MKGFSKGHKKMGGIKKGTPHVVTKKGRELFLQIMENQIENVNSSLENIRRESDYQYLNILSKLLPYFLPKMQDITIHQNEIPPIKFVFDNSEFKKDVENLNYKLQEDK